MARPKKTTTEAPPSMLGILRFDIDSSTIKIPPEVIIGIVVLFIIVEVALIMV